jgi:glycosyltransferase involved in cell wall biosynthesis
LTRPLVTIVTPSLNQSAFLEQTIESVLAQEYPAIEYAVVDGGSTDGSVEIIRRHEERLAWWASEPDRGQAAALNKGFARARGEILGWLASDDVLLPGAVARVVNELERDPGTLLVYGEALFVDENGREIFPLPARPFDRDEMLRRCENFVVQPGSLFRRRAWELAGPLDEESHYLFDFAFSLRVAAHGRVRAIDDRLALYRVHPESKSGGGSLLKARDYVRFAETELDGREGRARALLAAGDYFYDARQFPDARHALARSLRLHPTRRAAGLLARTLTRGAFS